MRLARKVAMANRVVLPMVVVVVVVVMPVAKEVRVEEIIVAVVVVHHPISRERFLLLYLEILI